MARTETQPPKVERKFRSWGGGGSDMGGQPWPVRFPGANATLMGMTHNPPLCDAFVHILSLAHLTKPLKLPRQGFLCHCSQRTEEETESQRGGDNATNHS